MGARQKFVELKSSSTTPAWICTRDPRGEGQVVQDGKAVGAQEQAQKGEVKKGKTAIIQHKHMRTQPKMHKLKKGDQTTSRTRRPEGIQAGSVVAHLVSGVAAGVDEGEDPVHHLCHRGVARRLRLLLRRRLSMPIHHQDQRIRLWTT